MAAALITTLQSLIQDTELLKKTYVIYHDKKVQVTNLMSLVALKIGRGEEIILCFEEDVDSYILDEIKKFFESVEHEDSRQIETDRLLMENSVTLQEAIASLPSGIVVVNRDNIITYVNEIASKLLGKPFQDLINYRADDVIQYSRLKDVLMNGETEVARKQQINTYTIITNRSPIFLDGKIIGAVAVFQDISNIEEISKELKEVRELQERLHLVLRSVSDLIGLTDQDGFLIYTNDEMNEVIGQFYQKKTVQSIVGEKVWKKVRELHEPFMKIIKIKNQSSYITKITSIVIDNEFRGTVVTMSPIHEIKSLLQQLDITEQRTKYLENELSKHQELDKAFEPIIGNSESLMDTLSMANKVSKTISTVIITGESGTGKELVARAIYEASDRKGSPFIRVNCAAIPPNLIESELFGYEKGAFTGAYKGHRGKFELAQNGTIFLDEIGDLSLDLQSKILRALQEKEINRIGGLEPIKLDVRIITATHQDLKKMVAENRFREDLYYRLSVIPIYLPPLRNRKEDIPLLVDSFREQLNQKLGKSIKGYERGFIERLCYYQDQ
jgi:transcriptional regulator with PAS, ATPase and Fis domain